MGTARTLTIGDTEVTRIGLGTNRLADTRQNIRFVQEAVAAGISLIDTAYTYAGGDSEATLGAALSPAPETVVVATKGGWAPGHGAPEILRKQIETSLRRLRTDGIGLYYLHRVHPDTPLDDSLRTIAEYRDARKIRHVGLSNVTVDQIEQGRRVVPIVAVQNHYSLTERKYEDVVDYCARERIVFVPYFPLRGTEGRAVAEIAARHETTEPQIALAWLLRRSATTLPIPGTLSIEHARENLRTLELELSDDEYDALR